jgi:hypothetical protein
VPFDRYEILLPLKYNDGTAVEPEMFQATRRELVGQLGALTIVAYPIRLLSGSLNKPVRRPQHTAHG